MLNIELYDEIVAELTFRSTKTEAVIVTINFYTYIIHLGPFEIILEHQPINKDDLVLDKVITIKPVNGSIEAMINNVLKEKHKGKVRQLLISIYKQIC